MQSFQALDVLAETAHEYSASVTSASHWSFTWRTSESDWTSRAILPRSVARSSVDMGRARGSSDSLRSMKRSSSFSHCAGEAIACVLHAATSSAPATRQLRRIQLTTAEIPRATAVTMPFASATDGARIHFDVADPANERDEARPTVVLVQGLGLSARFWFDLPRRLASATRPHRVVVLDNRGTGRSDKPAGRYKMATFADDVAAVMDEARIERATVVGISLGGMIAQHVALRHPRRVSGLVLMATTAGLPYARLPKLRALATLVGLPIMQRARGPAQIGRSLARLLLSEQDVPRARELLAEWPAAMRAEPVSPRAYFSQLTAVLGHSTGFRLKRVTCPTIVVTGDDDVLIPPHNSRMLARLVPGAHLEVLRACGHAISASDPDCVQRTLDRLDDWKEVRRAASAPIR